MIVDAICAPANIRYPQDASLLNEAWENTEKLLDELQNLSAGRKPRTYRTQAHRDFLHFSRSRKKTEKKIRKAVGKQLRYLARNLATIDQKFALGRQKRDEARGRTQDFMDECERVEVERRFSLAKRKCGLGRIVTKLRETIAHSAAMSILVLNLRKIPCAMLRLLALFALWISPQKKQLLFS